MHTNPDLLALLALGEDVADAEDVAHLANCPDCRSELDAFRAAAGTARRTTDRDVLVAPRPEVWQQITQELHLQPSTTGAVASAAGPASDALRPMAPPASERRRVRAAAFVLAAALALAVGIGLGANLDRVLQGEHEVASVPLNALPRFSGSSGRAVVEQDREGNRTLVVRISSPKPATGPRVVWMTTSLGEPMIAMGYLKDDQGRFPIDPSVDLKKFQLVDISQEPEGDQDFRHSGISIVRGKLPV